MPAGFTIRSEIRVLGTIAINRSIRELGRAGDDARRYQEEEVAQRIAAANPTEGAER